MMHTHHCVFFFESTGFGNINLNKLLKRETLKKKVFSNAKDSNLIILGIKDGFKLRLLLYPNTQT